MTHDSTYLNHLWQSHVNWSKGILYNKIDDQPKATFFWSDVPGDAYNFVVPKQAFTAQDVSVFEQEFAKAGAKPSIVLHAPLQSVGMTELLVRLGYKSECNESWVVLDKDAYSTEMPGVAVEEVAPQNFDDFYSVLSKVFAHWPGNEEYLDVCKKALSGELKSKCSDLVTQFFIVRDDGKPVSGAGLFYSKSENVAYLHDAGTLPEYRGKGYHTALLKHRANLSLEADITNIYSAVEPGGQSWLNFIRAGFAQTPWFILMNREEK